jgi:hypothetical protein
VDTNHHQDSRLDGEDNSVPLVLRQVEVRLLGRKRF